MRSNKSLCIDIGYMPREIASDEMTKGGSVRIGNRQQPYTHTNATWISDPQNPYKVGTIVWKNHPYDVRKTYAQINIQSSDEARILRLCRKWGWKIVNLVHPLGQNSFTEINLTNSDIEHKVERTNEVIHNWQVRL